MWRVASLFRRFTDTNVYRTGSVKIWKPRHKMSANIPIFFLQCRAISQVRHSEDNRVDTENRTVYIVIVVDYSTAFDTMDRGRLLIAADWACRHWS